ncbi:NAD-dependent epimerase/dehydratase family protein [Faecalicoccus pleomorphus]|uniref:NAD-dependent epimerase/dehydratase family protein n=2 Tax=Faecalicoccus pleomorphus TaxID=1323 RepID=A0A3E3E582_9FIRM|nr:NAD-dependent epimerase/dehydratase family protein [Faecalicoccus pleomorphus]
MRMVEFMEKVLIFGASGFVGSYLSQEFLNHDYEVYGSDKNVTEMLPKEVEFQISDILNSIQTEKLIGEINPDIIVNLAAISSVGASWNIPQATIDINVIGALNIMEAARKVEKKPKIMFIGSSEEYIASSLPINENTPLNASNPYGISKISLERFAKLYRDQYGLNIYCVRPFNHTGVGQRESFVLPSFCKQVAKIEKSRKSGVINVGNISVKRDFSHVKDIVRAYRVIVESDCCEVVYNVGSGKAYSLEKMLEYIISLSSQKIEIQIDQSRFRPTDHPVICCDHSLISEKLGWEPEYTVFDALKEMFEYYSK